jgi:hypothetical protein
MNYIYGHYLAGRETPFYVGLTNNGDSIKRPEKLRRWVSHVGERQWFASIIESFDDEAEAQLYLHQTVKHYGRMAIDKDVDAALVNVTMPSPTIDNVKVVLTTPKKKKRVAIKADVASNTNTSIAWSIYHCHHPDCQPDLPTPLNKLPALFGAAHKRHSV